MWNKALNIQDTRTYFSVPARLLLLALFCPILATKVLLLLCWRTLCGASTTIKRAYLWMLHDCSWMNHCSMLNVNQETIGSFDHQRNQNWLDWHVLVLPCSLILGTKGCPMIVKTLLLIICCWSDISTLDMLITMYAVMISLGAKLGHFCSLLCNVLRLSSPIARLTFF